VDIGPALAPWSLGETVGVNLLVMSRRIRGNTVKGWADPLEARGRRQEGEGC